MGFIIVPIVFLFIFFASAFIISLMEERDIWDCKKKPVLKFKDFKKYYYLNPDSWKLKYYTVIKAKQEFSFSFFETILYINFYKKKQKQKENDTKREKDKQAYIELLNSVQKDINRIRKKANKEIEESSKIMIQMKENFMKEEI